MRLNAKGYNEILGENNGAGGNLPDDGKTYCRMMMTNTRQRWWNYPQQ